MKLLFLGTGPNEPVVRSGSRNSRTNSSLLIKHNGKNILIDCTPQFEKQIKENDIDTIDSVILTHGHSDAIGGLNQLDELLKKQDRKIDFYLEGATSMVVINKFKLEQFNRIPISPNTKFESFGLKITPFRVKHFEAFPADGKKFPCLGFRIED